MKMILKLTRYHKTGRRAGGSRPKRRGEVGGLGKTRDLRGKEGRWMLVP